jgi:putative NIF3 family GTP cyclohydrolase 1 type 2
MKSGDPSQPIAGIVTTFIATCQVIERAIELGANLIITHEPTYFNHLDEVEWLENDPLYAYKRRLLEDNGIVVWRFHDYWHRHRPDGIYTGVLKELGWEDYADRGQKGLCTIPPMSLADLVAFLKERLGAETLRVVGDPAMICQGVALVVGAVPGERQIRALGRDDVDVLVCGETHEWQACEYVRDAAHAGLKKAQIILGHANSEEAGMKWLVEWLRPRFPDLPIAHLPAGDPLRFL